MMARRRRIPHPPAGVPSQSVAPWQLPSLRAALESWSRAVMDLDSLDPITTEVVRLRCAHFHDCHT